MVITRISLTSPVSASVSASVLEGVSVSVGDWVVGVVSFSLPAVVSVASPGTIRQEAKAARSIRTERSREMVRRDIRFIRIPHFY